MSTLLTALVLLIAFYIYKFYEKVRSYPRGPFPLPVLGNLLHIEYKRMHEYFHQQSQIYGPVFTVWMPRPYVVITDYHLIKEAFQKEDFAGRSGVFPDNTFQSVHNGGIIFSQGDTWKEQRRTSLHILRDFGMGKNIMEEKVRLSIEEFLATLKTFEEKGEVDFRWPMQLLVANVINELLYGFQYKFNDCDRLMNYVESLGNLFEHMRESVLTVFAQTFSWFEHVPYFGHRIVGFTKQRFNELHEVVKEDIERSLKNFDVDHDEPDCFVQAYVQRMKNAPDGSSLSYDQLWNVCSDFFIAGAETTSTTLKWAMLILAKEQDVQDKVREEILTHIGRDRFVKMDDRAAMPYTNATLLEILRVSNIVPTNVTHRTVNNTTIGKYQIPEDTLVLGQIWSVMTYASVFKNSSAFDPTRFLHDDGKTMVKETSELVVPFSIGRRQCAGESLARMELFMALVSIIQHYKIEALPGKEIDMEPIFGLTKFSKQQPLKITRVQ